MVSCPVVGVTQIEDIVEQEVHEPTAASPKPHSAHVRKMVRGCGCIDRRGNQSTVTSVTHCGHVHPGKLRWGNQEFSQALVLYTPITSLCDPAGES